jgi:V/A-type H+-transporting ATPase subunit I
MSWREAMRPVRMRRIAVVAPADSLREVLVRVADAGVVQLDRTPETTVGEAGRRLQRLRSGASTPALAVEAPDLGECERAGQVDLLAGEAELEQYANSAVRRGGVTGLAGWCPDREVTGVSRRLAGVGGAVVSLPAPRGVDPPTSLWPGGTVRRSFGGLVRTYGTVPYPDVDPTLLAGAAYVLMFGMMFGDAGHGLLLLAAALVLRIGWPRRLARRRSVWPFVAAAGLTSTLFGLLYGEFFGPTGVVPVLWLAPLAAPVPLLTAAVGIGAVLLSAAYAVAIVNRWREGGSGLAVYASSGIAGATLFLGLGGVVGGVYFASDVLAIAGGVLALVGMALAAVGFAAEAGGGAAGAVQAGVELVDTVIRVGSNVVSFARLAAFGLTHAALAWLVWQGTVSLFGHGTVGAAAGVVLFVVGNALAFALEALVAGIQALRLEFYELFSRIFAAEGRPFHPWRLPVHDRSTVDSQDKETV